VCLGFTEVYHLDGGILKYLEVVKPEDNLWQGECFVFDGRIAVDRHLQTGTHVMCYSCRMPLSPADRTSPHYTPGISCPYCHETLTDARRARLEERQYQVSLAQTRNDQHIGISLDERKTGHLHE
jgi:Predicted sulfurtransferase